VLTDEVQDRIISAVRAGSYLDDAAAYAGISRHTIHSWIRDGRAAEDRHELGEDLTDRDHLLIQFLNAIEKARADASIRNVGIIQQAAQDGQWQAAAWYLERTNPRKWGRHETVELTGSDGGAIQVQHSVKDTLAEKFAAAEKAAMQVIEAREVPTPQNELRQAQ
jgi:hypothetical protein